jgi:hypothetical protein
MDFTGLLDMVRSSGPWALLALVLYYFLRVLLDEDLSSVWRGRLFRTILAVSGRLDHEKQYISNDARGRLNLARRAIHFAGGPLPKAVDIAWMSTTPGAVVDVREGEFIVRLDPAASQAKNVALLAAAIVKRTTMVGIRHSVEAPLQAAIDLNLARQLLTALGNRSVLDWFLESEYVPCSTRDAPTRHRNDQIISIDERGLFTRLLMVELEAFARQVHGMPPRPYMAGEIEGLVDFLHALCTKAPGQRVPLSYERAYIRIGVIIVAIAEKFLDSIDPYVRAMDWHLRRQLTSIYVLAFDKEWLGEIDREYLSAWEKQLAEFEKGIAAGTAVTKDFDLQYSCVDHSGRRRKARCIRYTAPFSRGA